MGGMGFSNTTSSISSLHGFYVHAMCAGYVKVMFLVQEDYCNCTELHSL